MCYFGCGVDVVVPCCYISVSVEESQYDIIHERSTFFICARDYWVERRISFEAVGDAQVACSFIGAAFCCDCHYVSAWQFGDVLEGDISAAITICVVGQHGTHVLVLACQESFLIKHRVNMMVCWGVVKEYIFFFWRCGESGMLVFVLLFCVSIKPKSKGKKNTTKPNKKIFFFFFGGRGKKT